MCNHPDPKGSFASGNQNTSKLNGNVIRKHEPPACSRKRIANSDKTHASQEPREKSGNTDANFNHLWAQAKNGDSEALNKLSRLIAPELQRIAQVLLSKERKGHTLTTNGLINELYLRLLSNDLITINDRTHFFALAAKRMRYILIDHARRRNNQKNNNGQKPGTLDEGIHNHIESAEKNVENILDLDKALSELEKIHEGWARVVELRYFGGFQFTEVAEIMSINKRSAERYWSRARTWLFNYLKSE